MIAFSLNLLQKYKLRKPLKTLDLHKFDVLKFLTKSFKNGPDF